MNVRTNFAFGIFCLSTIALLPECSVAQDREFNPTTGRPTLIQRTSQLKQQRETYTQQLQERETAQANLVEKISQLTQQQQQLVQEKNKVETEARTLREIFHQHTYPVAVQGKIFSNETAVKSRISLLLTLASAYAEGVQELEKVTKSAQTEQQQLAQERIVIQARIAALDVQMLPPETRRSASPETSRVKVKWENESLENHQKKQKPLTAKPVQTQTRPAPIFQQSTPKTEKQSNVKAKQRSIFQQF